MGSMQKLALGLSIILFTALILVGCEGDYRKESLGSFGELVVVMDSTSHNSATAEAIRNTFGEYVRTIPNPQPMFDLTFTDFNTEEKFGQIKRKRNLLIVGELDADNNVSNWIRSMLSDEVEQSVRNNESFVFPLGDQWYRNQWATILTGSSDSLLAQKIRNSGDNIVQDLKEKEIKRWKYDIYEKGEQVALSDSLWDQHGWKFRIQHDYQLNIDTTYEEQNTGMVTLRRPLPKNDRWIWVWWDNEFTDFSNVDTTWINNMRDSLLEKYIRGSRDSSYVTTDYNRPFRSKTMEIDGKYTIKTRGLWRMTNDAMAGPYVNYTIYDDEQQRLFMIEFAQFAPRYDKRRFIRQFEAMARTFRTDSTWNERN